LGKEALLKCLSKPELMKVYPLQSATQIWSHLEEEEYSHVSDIKHTTAEFQFYSLRKKDSDSMESHIDKFSALQQEVDYHRPASIPPMTPDQINFMFIRTLGEAWFTFQQAIGSRIHTMKTAELYAVVKVADESEHLDDKTPVYCANFTTRSGKGGRGGFRGSYRKGSGNRGGPGYQGKSSNFKRLKAQMECVRGRSRLDTNVI
jgi:hypothetical protein